MGLDKSLVIDGGFATQLSIHVGDQIDGDPLWSAKFNATDPNAVIKTHLDFLEAGADVILTNTYQASVEGYTEYLELDEEQSIDLIKKTVRLAHVAREKFLSTSEQIQKNVPMIFASIGPYGAHLHDGSEYTGSYTDYVDPQEIKKWHRVRIDAVLEAGVDGLAIETIPALVEAKILLELLNESYPNVKFWLSLQCKDEVCLAHGEKFSDAARLLWEDIKTRQMLNNCLAIGVNCLHPKFVTPLFKSLQGSCPVSHRIPLIVYPNSGEVYTVQTGWTGKEDCVPLEYYIPEWFEIGTKIVGGCCRTNARDIKRIKDCVTRYVSGE